MSAVPATSSPIARIPQQNIEMDNAADWRIASVASSVLAEKEILTKEAPKKDWGETATLIVEDAFTIAYFGFETVVRQLPALEAVAGVSWAMFICGEVAGAINIAAAFISGKQAIQAYINGDKALGNRMLWDAITGLLLGVVMILMSTALKATALASVAAVLAEPWVYPLLFLLCMAYIIYELANREKNIITHKDLASQLNLDQLKKNLTASNFELPDFFKIDTSMGQAAMLKTVIEKMEALQANMGVEAALKAFRVWIHMLKKEKNEALAEIDQLKGRVAKWNQSQHIRSAQQALFFLGILTSLIGLSPRVSETALRVINDVGLTLANGLALRMDATRPFERNTPMVIPKVETAAEAYARICG